MSERIGVKTFAGLLGITQNALLKRVRRGVLERAALQPQKNHMGFYEWDRVAATAYADNLEKENKKPRLLDDLRTAAEIIRRIRLHKWEYDTDNATFAALKPEAKELVLDAMAKLKGEKNETC